MKNNRVVITNAAQLSVCGDQISDFWDAVLLKKSTFPKLNKRTGRYCYLVSERDNYENKYEGFIKTVWNALRLDPGNGRQNLIIGSTHGDYLSVLREDRANFPSRKRMEELLGVDIDLCCNVSTSCTSSLSAMGVAYRMIKSGQIENAVVGGCEVLDDFIMTGMDILRALSSKERSTPFSKKRDGTVLGEGCALFVIKSLESALQTEDRILAEIVGYANINDANDTTKPDLSGWGLSATMRACLQEAVLLSADIGYINSHGTGTRYNDITETNALKDVFNQNVLTSSIKPVIGHTLGACSALETLSCILALEHQIIPPTLSDVEPDEGLDIDYCFNVSRPAHLEYAVKNSMGFWGTNASVILKRWPKTDG